MTEIDVLRTWARRHGGDIVRVAPKDFAHVKQLPSFSDAPFSSNDIGVHWRSARVVYAGATLWTEFVHELGHCFASRVGIDDQFELSDAVAVMSAMPALLDFVRMATDTQRVQQETIAHLQQECIRMRAVVETAVNGWEPHATGSSGTASTAIR